MNHIKQLFCRHDYMRLADQMHREGHYVRMRAVYKCRKCGKEIFK